MIDLNDDFYRPVWIRLLLAALVLGWGLFEFASGAPFFGAIFLGAGLYAAWRFFVTVNPPGEDR